MINVLYQLSSNTDDSYVLNLQNNVLTIDVELLVQNKYVDTDGTKLLRTFNVPLREYAGKILSLQLINEEEIFAPQINTMYEFVDFYSNKKNNIMIATNDVINIARIAINNDLSNITIFLDKRLSDAPSIDCDVAHAIIELPSDTLRSKTSFLIEHDEFFKEKYFDYKHKSKLIGHVDYYNSIAYSEAQIDLLTRILLSALDELQLPEDIEELRKLLVVANDNSVLDIKSMDSVLAEFTTHKSNMRKLQLGYYDKEK